MNDDTPMPFGIHAGNRLADVPDAYLLWLYDNNKCFGALRAYIVDNLDAIRQNAGQPAKK